MLQGEIEKILPHRHPLARISMVTIGRDRIIGSLTVDQEMCRGHVINGSATLRGSDLFDVAAQLLGIYCAVNQDLRGMVAGKPTCFAREYGVAKFSKPLFPGDSVEIGLENCNVSAGGKNGSVIVTGADFLVTHENKLVAKIGYVKLCFS